MSENQHHDDAEHGDDETSGTAGPRVMKPAAEQQKLRAAASAKRPHSRKQDDSIPLSIRDAKANQASDATRKRPNPPPVRVRLGRLKTPTDIRRAFKRLGDAVLAGTVEVKRANSAMYAVAGAAKALELERAIPPAATGASRVAGRIEISWDDGAPGGHDGIEVSGKEGWIRDPSPPRALPAPAVDPPRDDLALPAPAGGGGPPLVHEHEGGAAEPASPQALSAWSRLGDASPTTPSQTRVMTRDEYFAALRAQNHRRVEEQNEKAREDARLREANQEAERARRGDR